MLYADTKGQTDLFFTLANYAMKPVLIQKVQGGLIEMEITKVIVLNFDDGKPYLLKFIDVVDLESELSDWCEQIGTSFNNIQYMVFDGCLEW